MLAFIDSLVGFVKNASRIISILILETVSREETIMQSKLLWIAMESPHSAKVAV